TGQLALAEQAVESTSRAVAITPPGDPARARYLVNVASAYLVLHERTDDAAHARTAVEFNRQAIDELGEDHPDLLGTLTQTIAPLVALASATNDEALFAEAVEIGRRVSSVPDDHRDVIPACSNAAHALLRRHDHTDDPRDALEALDLADRAARLTPDGSPHLPPVLNTLGGAQLKAGRIDDARHSFSRSAGAPSATVLDRIRAWRYLGRIELVANDPEAAVAAFAQAVSLLPRLTPQRFLRGDREFGLGQTTGIAAEAAAAAVRAGRPRQAVELIEQARTLLMSETLDARSDLRTLSELEPGLHGELQRLRDVIDAADHPVEAGLVGSPSAVRRDELTSEWNDLLDRIRTRPGLGTFLLPQPLGVDRGPVVFTYATRWGSGALVLGPGGTIDAVALPGITDISAAEQGDLFESASIAVTKASSYQARKAALDDMHAVLKWLWDNVTEPVLDHLGHTSPSSSDWPRVWWCPISVMSSLPLHAAGHHDEGPHRTVLDRVVSSYTTSMRTHAREPRRKGDAATLIVAMPETPGASPLPSASAEAAVITRMIPGAAVLTGADATRTAVERALVRHPIAHVACHAIGDALDPGGSRLLLHDHDTAGLTVAEVSRLDLPDADLVFLSACNTTDSAPRLVDEAVHITGAFHLAGYRHVIGTLTPVNSTAARVAGTVYEMLTNGGTKPPDTTDAALALHRAVRQIRADHLDAPHTWAAWIHVGL
ncbi:CHAT domain-containing protein, partial [Lentzea sp.]|uniref:CHAT domain-containing protein n=1 Tax=Lentzea sp. TaxID=56099 RepID=UPI002ED2DBCF